MIRSLPVVDLFLVNQTLGTIAIQVKHGADSGRRRQVSLQVSAIPTMQILAPTTPISRTSATRL
jgi:hypothetical protein